LKLKISLLMNDQIYARVSPLRKYSGPADDNGLNDVKFRDPDNQTLTILGTPIPCDHFKSAKTDRQIPGQAPPFAMGSAGFFEVFSTDCLLVALKLVPVSSKSTKLEMELKSLSAAAQNILEANPDAYGLLLAPQQTPALAITLLKNVMPEQLLRGPVRSAAAASAMLAGLWLWHDGLEESHSLSQKLDDADGSYWHAIMHRREGDFSNSKYWLARCRSHPVFARIAVELPKINGVSNPVISPLMKDGWNPGALVDLVERVHRSPTDPHHSLAVAIQRLEWKCLFEHCAHCASPDPS
jgi:hypothetical protein